MKYRQETIAEREWDGEFATYDEWARFGPQPPYRSATFVRSGTEGSNPSPSSGESGANHGTAEAEAGRRSG